MLKETFPAPKVARLLEQFVFVKIDTDEYPALANKYGAVGLPDVRLLSPEAEEFRRFRDFQGPGAFAEALDELLAEIAADATGNMLSWLSDGERELRKAFNQDVGNVRLVVVLSPTWGPCTDGARVVQKNILESVPDKGVKIYVVWIPVLQEDNREAAVEATRLVPDNRAQHYWDADKSLGFSLGNVVTLPRKRKLAWDVYFAFDAKAEWGDLPPKPAEWMHQLGTDERTLDGDKLRVAVEKLVRTSK